MKVFFNENRILTLGHSAGSVNLALGENPVADQAWLELLDNPVVKNMLMAGSLVVVEGVAGAESVVSELTQPSSYSDLEKRNIELAAKARRDESAKAQADQDAKDKADAEAKANADKSLLLDGINKVVDNAPEIAQLDAIIADAGTTLEEKEKAAARLQELTKG